MLLAALGCTPLLASCAASAGAPPSPSPQAHISELAAKFVATWNVHDARTFATTFAPAADFTNVFGVHVHGRPAIEAFHAKVFATVFKDSVQSIDSIEYETIAGATATARVNWSMSGATVPGWPKIQHGTISWNLVEQSDGSWLIQVMTNAVKA